MKDTIYLERAGRIDFVSKVQAIAIFLVVLGHSFVVPAEARPFWANMLHRFIYEFHMPLYMFVSGFLFMYVSKRKKQNYTNFIFKKVQRLLWPYLFLGTIAYVIKIFLNKYAARQADISIRGYIDSLLYPTHNANFTLWFIGCLFVTFLFAPILERIICINCFVGFFFLIITAIVHIYATPYATPLFGFSSISRLLIYFCIGIYIAEYNFQHLARLNNKYVLIVSVSIILLSAYLRVEYGFKVFIIPAISGIVFSLALGFKFSKANLNFKLLENYSYQIYLLSWFPQAAITPLYMRTDFMSFPFACFLSLCLGLFMPILSVKIIERYALLHPAKRLIGMN